ncbi:hypothetical protein MKX01_019000, partial [Papaver californicum]
MKERDAVWEQRMKAQYEEYNNRQNQIMEYLRLCRPDLFTRPGQLSGPSDHLFRTGEHHHRPWEQLPRHGMQPFIPMEQPKDLGSNSLDLGSNSLDLGRRFTLYRPGVQLNRPENN